MNIVFLSSEEVHQFYLINTVHRIHPVKKVFFQTSHIERATWRRRIRRISQKGYLRRFLRNAVHKIMFLVEEKRQRTFEEQMMFQSTKPELDPEIDREFVHSFNQLETVERVRAANPDLIVVFGTDILRGDILNVASVDILNIHRDILPDYRGGGLPFWVFYEKNFKMLGVTIHQCVAQLDSGAIVAQGFYELTPEDRIWKLRTRTTQLASELLIELIQKYKEHRVSHREQTFTKPMYTSRDLTLSKELKARSNFRTHVRSLRSIT